MTDDLLARLSAAAKRAAQLHQELGAEIERRNALVVAARDGGYSWRQISDASSLAVSTCGTIVGRS